MSSTALGRSSAFWNVELDPLWRISVSLGAETELRRRLVAFCLSHDCIGSETVFRCETAFRSETVFRCETAFRSETVFRQDKTSSALLNGNDVRTIETRAELETLPCRVSCVVLCLFCLALRCAVLCCLVLCVFLPCAVLPCVVLPCVVFVCCLVLSCLVFRGWFRNTYLSPTLTSYAQWDW